VAIWEYTLERLCFIEDAIGNAANEERKNALLIIKENILKFMRMNFKVVNSREVRTIGYDTEKKICVIEYNHSHSGKTVYYYDISQEQFDILMKSEDISKDADFLFKDKVKR
jgi:hypothetical protein